MSNTKGSVRGKRDRYYFCVGFDEDDNKIISHVMIADSKDEAAKSFKDHYGFEATDINDGSKVKDRDGNVVSSNGLGFYVVKGNAQENAPKSVITVTAQQLADTTGKQWNGTFKGWKVIASGLQGFEHLNGKGEVLEEFEDNEVVLLNFTEPVSKDPKPKMKRNECVRIGDIENRSARERVVRRTHAE